MPAETCYPGYSGATPSSRMTVMAALALPLLVLVIDAVIFTTDLPYAVLGLLDETAHLATVALLLLTVHLWEPLLSRFTVAALVAGVAIDVDHIPGVIFGSQWLTVGTPRPYPHSLLTVLAILLVGGILRGQAGLLAAGAATGVGLHLLRDLSWGNASLLWPISKFGFHLPYWLYVVALAAASALCLAAARSGRCAPMRTQGGNDSDN